MNKFARAAKRLGTTLENTVVGALNGRSAPGHRVLEHFAEFDERWRKHLSIEFPDRSEEEITKVIAAVKRRIQMGTEVTLHSLHAIELEFKQILWTGAPLTFDTIYRLHLAGQHDLAMGLRAIAADQGYPIGGRFFPVSREEFFDVLAKEESGA